jgi:hypothetical protein
MADTSPHRDSTGNAGDDTSVGPNLEPTTSTPHWVKAFLIALVLVLLLAILHLAGGGLGPADHTPGVQ